MCEVRMGYVPCHGEQLGGRRVVTEEKITALYVVWFSFKLRLIVLVVGAAVKNKKTSVKRKKLSA